jgi:hypothetical protein
LHQLNHKNDKEKEMDRQYNNELTPEVLATMDQSPFTAEQLSGMNDETRALISEQQEYYRQHPVNTIYRIAVDGSLTREGDSPCYIQRKRNRTFRRQGRLMLHWLVMTLFTLMGERRKLSLVRVK